jgi:putative NADH-flavin reductase
MKLTIFGATGRTGLCLVEQALAAGHEVTVMIRNPAALALKHERLRVMVGVVQNRADVEAAVKGNDAVLSSLGTNQRGVTVCTDGARNILAAMDAHGVKRLVAISAYGAAESHHRNLYNFMLWAALKEKMLDKEQMESLIKGSPVDWTLVRPPYMTKGPHTGCYRFGKNLRMSLVSHISRSDVAEFILQHLTDTATFRQALSITSGK